MDLGLGLKWMDQLTLREMDAVGLRRYERYRATMELQDDFHARTASAMCGKPYTDIRLLKRSCSDVETGGDPHENDITWEQISSIGPFARARSASESEE